jgi:hypothetical protein
VTTGRAGSGGGGGCCWIVGVGVGDFPEVVSERTLLYNLFNIGSEGRSGFVAPSPSGKEVNEGSMLQAVLLVAR